MVSHDMAHPLTWPAGWARADVQRPSRFGRGHWVKPTVHVATRSVLLELERLGATDVVISTNLALRRDGLPRSGQRKPEDPGVAVYFTLAGQDRVLACDSWDEVGCNLTAIAKHIDALRGQSRWGVGSVEQAFAGFRALPRASGDETDHWWVVLGVSRHASAEDVRKAARDALRDSHPDRGGDPKRFLAVKSAREQALAALLLGT